MENLSEKILFSFGKHCFAGRKAPFCGLGSDVFAERGAISPPVRGGRRRRIYLPKDVAVGAGKTTYLPAQGCGCRCREDGCMKSMRENSACRQFQGNYPITNYELQITVSKFQFKKSACKILYYIYNICIIYII